MEKRARALNSENQGLGGLLCMGGKSFAHLHAEEKAPIERSW